MIYIFNFFKKKKHDGFDEWLEPDEDLFKPDDLFKPESFYKKEEIFVEKEDLDNKFKFNSVLVIHQHALVELIAKEYQMSKIEANSLVSDLYADIPVSYAWVDRKDLSDYSDVLFKVLDKYFEHYDTEKLLII